MHTAFAAVFNATVPRKIFYSAPEIIVSRSQEFSPSYVILFVALKIFIPTNILTGRVAPVTHGIREGA
jgi:hypothetical protein